MNITTNPVNFDAWIMVRLPNGNMYKPVLLRNGLTIPAGITMTRNLTQYVPWNAPVGSYSYIGNIGIYPDSVYATDDFSFVKLIGDGTPENDLGWTIYGWDEEEITVFIPKDYTKLTAHPNPFNPSTVLSFELRARGFSASSRSDAVTGFFFHTIYRPVRASSLNRSLTGRSSRE